MASICKVALRFPECSVLSIVYQAGWKHIAGVTVIPSSVLQAAAYVDTLTAYPADRSRWGTCIRGASLGAMAKLWVRGPDMLGGTTTHALRVNHVSEQYSRRSALFAVHADGTRATLRSGAQSPTPTSCTCMSRASSRGSSSARPTSWASRTASDPSCEACSKTSMSLEVCLLATAAHGGRACDSGRPAGESVFTLGFCSVAFPGQGR